VQETFLQVHLAAGTFDPQRAFKPWLYTVAANKGRDYMRARGRRPVQSLDGPERVRRGHRAPPCSKRVTRRRSKNTRRKNGKNWCVR
jgi:DNA-directed RNA polymerase specialized sigma24 family protein